MTEADVEMRATRKVGSSGSVCPLHVIVSENESESWVVKLRVGNENEIEVLAWKTLPKEQQGLFEKPLPRESEIWALCEKRKLSIGNVMAEEIERIWLVWKALRRRGCQSVCLKKPISSRRQKLPSSELNSHLLPSKTPSHFYITENKGNLSYA